MKAPACSRKFVSAVVVVFQKCPGSESGSMLNGALHLDILKTQTTCHCNCHHSRQQHTARSEERRVGKECRSRWSPCELKTKKTRTVHRRLASTRQKMCR